MKKFILILLVAIVTTSCVDPVDTEFVFGHAKYGKMVSFRSY